jgi:hypothetical protein
LTSNPPYLQLHKIKPLGEKERHNKSLGEEWNTLSDPRDNPKKFKVSFGKLYKKNLRIGGWTLVWEKLALYKTVLTLKHQRWGEAIWATRVR